MNLKEILKSGGATLTKELKALEKNDGYMVSKIGCEKTFTLDNLKDLEKEVINYRNKLKNNEYIGIWIDKDIIYLDISKHYTTKDKAIKSGIKNKQLAIYDLKNNKSVYLTKKAYIIYRYNKINNDLIYYKEFYNLNDIKKEFNLKNSYSVYNYIVEDIDNDSYNNLLDNKYIIITDNIPLNEI